MPKDILTENHCLSTAETGSQLSPDASPQNS